MRIYLVECAVQVTPCGEENESRFSVLAGAPGSCKNVRGQGLGRELLTFAPYSQISFLFCARCIKQYF